jgi:exodeoxyribonuclease VII small subunit
MPKSPRTPAAELPATFEDALGELETLVQTMESGSLPLEQSLQAYRRGAQLVTFCRDALTRVQQQVRVLEDDLLKPFDSEAAGEA